MHRPPVRPPAPPVHLPTLAARLLVAWLLVGSAGAGDAAGQEPPTDTGVEVVEVTVDGLHRGYAEGRFTVEEVVRAHLARVVRWEPRYNAFISMNPRALERAQALDLERAAGGELGPLHGVPVVIKDNLDMAGLVTSAGFDGFSSAAGGIDLVPDDDAAVVERLQRAGAVILGKTNLPDFAGHGTRTGSSVAGVTLNPYNVDKAPGGSSGGTATAVNASFAVLGLGTETGGSIQNPSSAQALVGIKPTYGLVPNEGVVPLSGTYVDVVGPMARSVHDAALALDVLAGPTHEDLATFAAVGHLPDGGYAQGLTPGSLRGRRFGLVGPGWREDFLPLAPETEARYRWAVTALEDLGAETVEDPFAGTEFVSLWDARDGVPSQGAYDLHRYLQQTGAGAAFHSVEEWEALTDREFSRARNRDGEWIHPVRPSATEEGDAYQAWRAELLAVFRGVLEEHDLDGLFFPQAGAPAPDLVEDPERPDHNPNNWPELPSNIINDLGLPVITVPYAYYDDGTPFVVAFIGDRWSERSLVEWAFDFERATGARVPPVLSDGGPG